MSTPYLIKDMNMLCAVSFHYTPYFLSELKVCWWTLNSSSLRQSKERNWINVLGVELLTYPAWRSKNEHWTKRLDCVKFFSPRYATESNPNTIFYTLFCLYFINLLSVFPYPFYSLILNTIIYMHLFHLRSLERKIITNLFN